MKINLPEVGAPFELTLDEVPVTETDDIFRALILDLVEHDRWEDLAELREILREAEDTVDWVVPYFEVADLLCDRKREELTPEKLNDFFEETYVLSGWVRYQVNRLVDEKTFPEVPISQVEILAPRNLKGQFLSATLSPDEHFLVGQLLETYFPSFFEDPKQHLPAPKRGRYRG